MIKIHERRKAINVFSTILTITIKSIFMKFKYILTALILLISSLVHSQSVKDLDDKNGFKSYKLGTSKELIDKIFGIVKVGPKENYIVIRNPEKKVFDFNVKRVELTFDKDNLLGCIDIILEEGQRNLEIGVLAPYFEALFGNKTGWGEVGDSGDGYERWAGKNVGLEVYYHYKGYQIGWIPEIKVYSLKFLKEISDDGF